MITPRKLLFVVHRYAPYPGGSEYYVQDMAEEAFKRGHAVTVLAGLHQGDLNGVRVTSDYNILFNRDYHLTLVHGGDVQVQNAIHINAYQINRKNPVAYMLIKPSATQECMTGFQHHRVLTYSTWMDIQWIKINRGLDRARRIRHGVVPEKTIKTKQKNSVPTYVSAGGFYPHKAMVPLAEAFENSNVPGELHLYGYGEGPLPRVTDRVKVFFGEPKHRVLQAIANADAYIMNSYEEGFGLVLLEAMMNKTPWLAREVGGVRDMASYGTTYENEGMLMKILPDINTDTNRSFDYAMTNHSIVNTVDDIEDIVDDIYVG